MGLKEQIERAMLAENLEDKIAKIAKMAEIDDKTVRDRVKDMGFKDWLDVNKALEIHDGVTIKNIIGLPNESTGISSSTLSPSEMRAKKTGMAIDQEDELDPQDKATAMQRLGRDNLGGKTAGQVSKAVDKAADAKALTPIERKALAQQAGNVERLATDPKTATQFRALLNKLK